MNPVGTSEFHLSASQVDHIPAEAGGVQPEDAVLDDEVSSGSGGMEGGALVGGVVALKYYIIEVAHSFIENPGSNIIGIIGIIGMAISDGDSVKNTFLAIGSEDYGVVTIVP